MGRPFLQACAARRERGAVAVLVAIMMVALILMIGLVLDLSHLFIVKNELQNAADSCALSAVRELNDLSATALDRATASGITAGARNKADLQRDPVDVQTSDVTFGPTRDGPWSRPSPLTAATPYVRCAPHEANLKSVSMWFMQLAGADSYLLKAEAVARLVPGQSFCAIPLAMCTNTSDASDLVVGTWYGGRMPAGGGTVGNYDWIQFEESQHGAARIKELLCGEGYCAPRPNEVGGEGGSVQGAQDAWNTRFGLYGGGYTINECQPDRSGYAYTPVQLDNHGDPIPGSGTWTNPPHAPPQNAYPDFETRRASNTPYDPNSVLAGNGKPDPRIPSPISTQQHHDYGGDRRTVIVPVINCNAWQPGGYKAPVIAYACALMTAPIVGPDLVTMEFRGLEGSANCASAGGPGSSGPAVPTLVK